PLGAPMTTPDGSQIAYLYFHNVLGQATDVGQFSQTILFPSSGLFTVSYQVIGRSINTVPIDGNLDHGVFLDSTLIASDSTVTPFPPPPWPHRSFVLTPTAGLHELKFLAFGPFAGNVGDHTAFFDTIIVSVPEPSLLTLISIS